LGTLRREPCEGTQAWLGLSNPLVIHSKRDGLGGLKILNPVVGDLREEVRLGGRIMLLSRRVMEIGGDETGLRDIYSSDGEVGKLIARAAVINLIHAV
jgi:hypothetical protein